MWLWRQGTVFENSGALSEQVQKALRIVATSLRSEDCRYRGRFSNKVLWPLCHLSLDKVLLDARRDWGGQARHLRRVVTPAGARYRA